MGDYERNAKGFAQENSEVSRNSAHVAGRVVIAVAAILALTLAVFIVREIVDYPGHVELGTILRGAVVAAVFVVIVFMMISYLLRKSKLRE